MATEDEKAVEEILTRICVTHGQREKGSPGSIFIGGTALRIAWGLRRPSTDLDAVHLSAGPDLWQLAEEILRTDMDRIVTVRADPVIAIRTRITVRKRGLLERWFGKATNILVDDLRGVIDVPHDQIRFQNGIWTTTPHVLMDLKLRALPQISVVARQKVGLPADGRIESRDLYDATFLVQSKLDEVSRAQVFRLTKTLENSVLADDRSRWDEAFELDDIMSRTSLGHVLEQLHAGIEQWNDRYKEITGRNWDEDGNAEWDTTPLKVRRAATRRSQQSEEGPAKATMQPLGIAGATKLRDHVAKDP